MNLGMQTSAAALIRFRERAAAFKMAVKCVAALGRRLMVIGDPDAGMHTRLMRAYGCGDAQERALAAGYRRSAEALRARWPQTAWMLEALAATYEAEAERYDEQARTRRVASGYGPEPERRAGAEGSVPADPAGVPRVSEMNRLVNLEVQGVGPAPLIALDAAPRLNLIAGDNSQGKTFLLDVAWWCLTGTWPEVEVETAARERGRTRRIAIPAADSREARIRVRDDDGAQASTDTTGRKRNGRVRIPGRAPVVR